MRLLLVEDEIEIQGFLKRSLTEAGYHVDVAGDATAAEILAREEKHYALIVDLGLPDRDGITLIRLASGVKSIDTSCTFSANPTINALATAITALGNGWSAQIVGDAGAVGGQGDYGLWPSADLFIPQSYGLAYSSQGALTARGQYAELKMHTYELAGYQWDPRGWLLRAIPYTDPELLHPEDLIWPVGVNNFRIQYTAGYATIPESVQEACAEWVSILWSATQRDPGLTHQQTPGGPSQNWGTLANPKSPPNPVQALLQPYRRYSIGTNQG